MRHLYFIVMIAGILRLAPSAYAAPVPVADYSKPIRVTCVGDSITAGTGLGIEWSYVNQMARMLGEKWDVHNFGVSGATMLQKSDYPYEALPEYKKALQSEPNVVIIALGTNDVKPQNWKQDKYVHDYQEMISAFQALPTKPLIYLSLPPPVFPPGGYTIPGKGTDRLLDLIRTLADENHCNILDFYTPMKPHPEWLMDHVHPSREGAYAMAKVGYAGLLGTDYTGEMLPPPPEVPHAPAAQ